MSSLKITNFLILLYFIDFTAYMKNKFSLPSSSYDLLGNYILSLNEPRTTIPCEQLVSPTLPKSEASASNR